MSKVEKIVHWLRWNFTKGESLYETGDYVVIYPDGERTMPVNYSLAVALRNVHGGMIAYKEAE